MTRNVSQAKCLIIRPSNLLRYDLVGMTTKTSFTTFDEVTDVGTIITAIDCANNSVAD